MAVSSQMVNLDNPADRETELGHRKTNKAFLAFALIVFLVGTLYIGFAISWTLAITFLVGGVLGATLYYARYGFTSAWRNFIVARRGAGLRSHMVMFFIANILFLPLLLRGHMFGHPVAGYVSPVGISVFFGSFLFGLGMQIADGCASGTLFHTGGGDVRGIVTIIGFIIGSVLGSLNFPYWTSQWNMGPVSFLKTFGNAGGFLFSLLLMAIVFFGSLLWEKKRNGNVENIVHGTGRGWKTFFTGPWSLLIGGIILAIGNAVVLVLTGQPWGVTFAFALVGAKIAQAFGMHIGDWTYWHSGGNAAALHSNIMGNATVILDIAVMAGALLAASLAGKFPRPYFRRFPMKMLIGILIGGIFMGYGARIAFGCNIGAYFDGIASFSLHGWAWMVCGFIGSIVGIWIRPLLGFVNRK